MKTPREEYLLFHLKQALEYLDAEISHSYGEAREGLMFLRFQLGVTYDEAQDDAAWEKFAQQKAQVHNANTK